MKTEYQKLLDKKLRDIDFAETYGRRLAQDGIAIALYKAREASGKTREDLATELSVTPEYIFKLEAGRVNATIGMYGQIFAHLNKALVIGTEPLNK